jgi:hypothetical protein
MAEILNSPEQVYTLRSKMCQICSGCQGGPPLQFLLIYVNEQHWPYLAEYDNQTFPSKYLAKN